jgi:hypothetical protein
MVEIAATLFVIVVALNVLAVIFNAIGDALQPNPARFANYQHKPPNPAWGFLFYGVFVVPILGGALVLMIVAIISQIH